MRIHDTYMLLHTHVCIQVVQCTISLCQNANEYDCKYTFNNEAHKPCCIQESYNDKVAQSRDTFGVVASFG